MERTVKHGKQNQKDCAARSRDAGGTKTDWTENVAAAYEKENYKEGIFTLENAEVQYRQIAIVEPLKDEIEWVEF